MSGDDEEAIALDTTQAIAVLNNTGAGTWIRPFTRVCLPAPVVGELLYGALNSGRPESNRRRVETLIARCEVLPVGAATAGAYARVRLGLKRKGRPIPENDVWIAALARQHDLTLVSRDRHFSNVDRLRFETW